MLIIPDLALELQIISQLKDKMFQYLVKENYIMVYK